MTQSLMTEIRWATLKEKIHVMKTFFDNNGCNFTGDEEMGFILEVDINLPEETRKKFRK